MPSLEDEIAHHGEDGDEHGRDQARTAAAAAATAASLRSDAIATAIVCDEISCEEVEVVRSMLPTISCDEISCEEVAVPAWRPSRPAIVWPRTLAFLLYGGLYQGICQLFIFNEVFPALFGTGTDLGTVTAKVLTDQFVLTPLLCLQPYVIVAVTLCNSGCNPM